MYPILKDDVTYGTFQYDDGSDETHYFFENPSGETFEVDYEIFSALLRADGTEPLALSDPQNVLPELIRCDLVQTSRFVRSDIFNRFILFPLGNNVKRYRRLCSALNAVLPVLSVLVFVIGVVMKMTSDNLSGYEFDIWLYYGLYILSLALHEMGHLAAGLAYGYRMSEIGVLLFGVIPCGAYVAGTFKKRSKRSERIQFSLAGIEMNLLIAGICLIVSILNNAPINTLTQVANLNIMLVILNLIPTLGLDGESVLSCMCGVDNIGETAKEWLTVPELRTKLFHSGLAGYECLFIFGVAYISKYILFLLLIAAPFISFFL